MSWGGKSVKLEKVVRKFKKWPIVTTLVEGLMLPLGAHSYSILEGRFWQAQS